MSRKQLYNIMYDMLRQNDLAGARLLKICKNNLQQETAVDVITETFRMIIPSLIKNHIPLESYEQCHAEIFTLILDNILSSGIVKDNSTKHLLFDAMITSARNDDIKLIKTWFEKGEVTNRKGNKIDMEISLKHKHSVVCRIWSALDIPLAEKEACMASLEKLDTS